MDDPNHENPPVSRRRESRRAKSPKLEPRLQNESHFRIPGE